MFVWLSAAEFYLTFLVIWSKCSIITVIRRPNRPDSFYVPNKLNNETNFCVDSKFRNCECNLENQTYFVSLNKCLASWPKRELELDQGKSC